MKREIRDLTKDIRYMDWEKLCWRQMKWTLIPDDVRKHVLSFLTVPENICLNNAMTCHKDEEGDDLRDQLIKSYRGAVIPAFGTYRFTDKDNFKGVYWVIKMGIELQGLELILTELRGGVVKKADKVLRWLVANGHEELAALHATKSSAKDTVKRDANLGANISTLSLAAIERLGARDTRTCGEGSGYQQG